MCRLSPFTGVQAQGIVDRRLLLVPFLERIEATKTKHFDLLFPAEEIQNIVKLATKVCPKQIRKFLLGARNHEQMRQIIIEHYTDSNDHSILLQRFVTEKLQYKSGSFISYGLKQKKPGTLSYEFEKWKARQDTSILGNNRTPIQLKQILLPYIHMNFPEWTNGVDRRRAVNGSKPLGITNIMLKDDVSQVTKPQKLTMVFDMAEYRDSPWWIKTHTAETSAETSTDSGLYELSPTHTTLTKFLNSVVLSSLDLDSATRVRSQLLRCGNAVYKEKERETVLLLESGGTAGALAHARDCMFENNDVVALDTEFIYTDNPNKS